MKQLSKGIEYQSTLERRQRFNMVSSELERKLKRPFYENEIEWRVQQMDKQLQWAMVLAYVTNRAIQDRLDEVFGVLGWQNTFKEAPNGGVLCGISVYNGEEWITKYDGAENTNVEAVKGGLSSAMKRAAVQYGIGRYLYDLETNFVKPTNEKPNDMKGWVRHYDANHKVSVYWKTPTLPEWALPKDEDIEDDK